MNPGLGLHRTDPARHLRTTGQDRDDLDRDLTDVCALLSIRTKLYNNMPSLCVCQSENAAAARKGLRPPWSAEERGSPTRKQRSVLPVPHTYYLAYSRAFSVPDRSRRRGEEGTGADAGADDYQPPDPSPGGWYGGYAVHDALLPSGKCDDS